MWLKVFDHLDEKDDIGRLSEMLEYDRVVTDIDSQVARVLTGYLKDKKVFKLILEKEKKSSEWLESVEKITSDRLEQENITIRFYYKDRHVDVELLDGEKFTGKYGSFLDDVSIFWGHDC